MVRTSHDWLRHRLVAGQQGDRAHVAVPGQKRAVRSEGGAAELVNPNSC